jgi:baculoviral IAP repeat-containing protein 6
LNNKNESKNQEGRDTLWLCRKISDLASYLFGEDHAKVTATDCGIIDATDNDIFATYVFTKDAQCLRQSRPGRIKRLIAEIKTLKTSLSTGIYVKFASTGLDVMK